MDFLLGCSCRFVATVDPLAYDLQSRGDLIQGLLNSVELQLRSVSELLDAGRRALKMADHVGDNLAATLAQKEHPKSSDKHSQAA
jgi:hypothetical protein